MPEPFDFRDHADRLLLLSSVLAETVDLEGILATISSADAVGPILYPGAYRDAIWRGDLEALGRLARAAQNLQREARAARDLAARATTARLAR